MVNIWSNDEFTRKVKTIKDWMRDDHRYSVALLTRVVTKSGGGGLYDIGVTVSHTDTVVSGIVVYDPQYRNYNEEVMTTNTDAQFTCATASKATVLAADELWLDYTLTGSAVTAGTMYKIKSDRSSLYALDHIFELDIAGKQSAS